MGLGTELDDDEELTGTPVTDPPPDPDEDVETDTDNESDDDDVVDHAVEE